MVCLRRSARPAIVAVHAECEFLAGAYARLTERLLASRDPNHG